MLKPQFQFRICNPIFKKDNDCIYNGCFDKHASYILNQQWCLSVCLSDKQGRALAVTFAFPGRYLLAAPHEFWTNQMVLSVCGDKQGRAGQGRAARANTRPLDLLAIYRILGENRGTCI